MSVHVIPLNDEKPHEYTTSCPCNPTVDWLDPETNLPWTNGSYRVIHNAFDCREIVERAIGESLNPANRWAVYTD